MDVFTSFFLSRLKCLCLEKPWEIFSRVKCVTTNPGFPYLADDSAFKQTHAKLMEAKISNTAIKQAEQRQEMQHTNTIKLIFCWSLENGAICGGCSLVLGVLLLCGLDVGRVIYSLWKVSAFERAFLCFPWGDKWNNEVNSKKKNTGLFIKVIILINKKHWSVLTESMRFSMEKDNVIFSGGTESAGISWLSDGDWIKKSLNPKQTKNEV